MGKDSSGKCDACKTGNDKDFVYGVVYEISDRDKPELDRREDLGYGYGEKTVEVVSAGHRLFRAITYYAIRIDPLLKPFHWYKEHVLIGAKENGLPETYIQMLSAVVSVDDPVQVRCKKELAIYV